MFCILKEMDTKIHSYAEGRENEVMVGRADN